MKFCLHHFSIFVIAFFNLYIESANINISSANARIYIPIFVDSYSTNSLINTLNSNGDNEYPYGTPFSNRIG